MTPTSFTVVLVVRSYKSKSEAIQFKFDSLQKVYDLLKKVAEKENVDVRVVLQSRRELIVAKKSGVYLLHERPRGSRRYVMFDVTWRHKFYIQIDDSFTISHSLVFPTPSACEVASPASKTGLSSCINDYELCLEKVCGTVMLSGKKCRKIATEGGGCSVHLPSHSHSLAGCENESKQNENEPCVYCVWNMMAEEASRWSGLL